MISIYRKSAQYQSVSEKWKPNQKERSPFRMHTELNFLYAWRLLHSQIPLELSVACGYQQGLPPEEGAPNPRTRCLRWEGRIHSEALIRVWMREVAEWWITTNQNVIWPTKRWDLLLNEAVIDPVRGILKWSLFINNSVGFPGGSVVKNLQANARDSGLIPDWEDSHAAEQPSLWATTTDPVL